MPEDTERFIGPELDLDEMVERLVLMPVVAVGGVARGKPVVPDEVVELIEEKHLAVLGSVEGRKPVVGEQAHRGDAVGPGDAGAVGRQLLQGSRTSAPSAYRPRNHGDSPRTK